MQAVRYVQARQGHAVPVRVGRAMGPFPPEIFNQTEVVNPYNEEPDEWLVCSECGGRELEVNVQFHVCEEYDDETPE